MSLLVRLKNHFGGFVLIRGVLAVGALTHSDASQGGACAAVLHHRLACGLLVHIRLATDRNISDNFMSFYFNFRLVESVLACRFSPCDDFLVLRA